MTVTKCVFSAAWQKLKNQVDTGKTSWGKVELRELMYECLNEAAKETDAFVLDQAERHST